jgi:hypothetical protein
MRYWLSETIPKASIFIFLNELNKKTSLGLVEVYRNAILNLHVANTLSSDLFFTNVTLAILFSVFLGSIQSGLTSK